MKLPPDLPAESYEGIRLAVSSLLELWGVEDAGTHLISAEADHPAVTTNRTGE